MRRTFVLYYGCSSRRSTPSVPAELGRGKALLRSRKRAGGVLHRSREALGLCPYACVGSWNIPELGKAAGSARMRVAGRLVVSTITKPESSVPVCG